MAAAAQPPPAQQQPTAPDTKPPQGAPTQKPDEQPRHPHNASNLLESMQAMLNGALLEIGHSMKNPQRPKLTFPSTQGLFGPKHNNISISASSERFHHCLDEIEQELSRAKAILRRDLAVQREEREKREKAEQERAAEAEKKMAAEKKAAPASVSAPAATQRQEQQQKDIEMADAAPAAAINNSKPAADAPSVVAHTHLPPRPPAIQTTTSDAAQPAPATATTDDLFGRTPTTAGMNTTDFDSMFEDFANSNENDNSGGDTSMGGDGVSDEFDFALLPGLESYANSDGNKAASSSGNKDNGAAPEIDFSVLDNASAQEQSQKKAQEEEEEEEQKKKKQEEEEKKKKEEEEQKRKEEEEQKKKKEEEEKQNQQQQDNQDLNEVFQGDSTFDDLFNYTDFDMGGSTGGGDTTFDDDFFNI